MKKETKRKFMFWLIGFTAPIFMFWLGLLYYDFIANTYSIYERNNLWIHLLLLAVFSYEGFYLWYAEKFEELGKLTLKKEAYWMAIGLTSFFFVGILIVAVGPVLFGIFELINQ